MSDKFTFWSNEVTDCIQIKEPCRWTSRPICSRLFSYCVFLRHFPEPVALCWGYRTLSSVVHRILIQRMCLFFSLQKYFWLLEDSDYNICFTLISFALRLIFLRSIQLHHVITWRTQAKGTPYHHVCGSSSKSCF